MGLTPGNNRKKAAAPAEPNWKDIDARRRKWIALVPPTIDTVTSLDSAHADEALQLTWNVAGCARQFMEWTHFQPRSWQAPAWYPERLGRMCAWLAAQPAEDLVERREDAVQILQAAWPKQLAYLRDPELLYDTIPSLYTPEDLDEFGPLDMPLPYLPHWRVQLTPQQEAQAGPEMVAARREAARIGEEFCLYAGLTTYLNTHIGLKLLNLEVNVF